MLASRRAVLLSAQSGIRFRWGNGSSGNAGAITGTSATVGVTNAAGSNGVILTGDLLIAIVNLQNGTTDPGIVNVTGFTTIVENWFASGTIRTWVGYKVAGASDVASYAANWANTSNCGWVLLDFSGVDRSNPIDVSDIQPYVASQTHTVPSITPTAINDMWLAIEARVGANSPDPPNAPLMGAYDIRSNSSGRPQISTAYLQLSSTAATGTGSFTQTAFTQASHGISIALRAA